MELSNNPQTTDLFNNLLKGISITQSNNKFYIKRNSIDFKYLMSNPIYSKFNPMNNNNIHFNALYHNQAPGFNIIVNGRLRGRKRATNIRKLKGVIKVSSLSHYMQAKNFPVQTKWGKLGVRLCIN